MRRPTSALATATQRRRQRVALAAGCGFFFQAGTFAVAGAARRPIGPTASALACPAPHPDHFNLPVHAIGPAPGLMGPSATVDTALSPRSAPPDPVWYTRDATSSCLAMLAVCRCRVIHQAALELVCNAGAPQRRWCVPPTAQAIAVPQTSTRAAARSAALHPCPPALQRLHH